jgi:hypothetical protein
MVGGMVQDLEPLPRKPDSPKKGPEDMGPYEFRGVCLLQDWLPCPSPKGVGGLGAGGPRETTSLGRLFSMELATADKPYQLISHSHRQTESAPSKWPPGAPPVPCPAGS